MHFRWWHSLTLAVALGFAAPAYADVKPGDHDHEEKDRVPDAQGSGTDAEKEGADAFHSQNPLPKIVEMIRSVEDRLVESDTSDWTQAEQQRIVRALEGQGWVVKALEDLIREAESHSGGT